MSSELLYVQVGVEAALAGLAWWLYCRGETIRGRLADWETEHGLTQKKLETAVGDLHQRLQQAEKRWQAPPARKEPGVPRLPEPARYAKALAPRTEALALSRGERDLLAKVRELGRR